jgi:hypothetical protein
MDEGIREHMNNIHSDDRVLQGKAFRFVLEATDRPVDWAYEVWDDMVKTLSHRDNHQRAIAPPVRYTVGAYPKLARIYFPCGVRWCRRIME